MKASAFVRPLRWAVCTAVLAGCSSLPPADTAPPQLAHQWAGGEGMSAQWHHHLLPGKAPVQFRYVHHQGRPAVYARSSSAASMLRRSVQLAPDDIGTLRFSWQVPQLIAGGDLGQRDAADSPVRVILAFDGDRSRFSARDSLLAELARSVTGEEMPYATLMYVWCNQRPPGSIIHNPRTARVRKLVLESGPARLGRWLDYERDVRADFERVFGESPGRLLGIAIMTDSDNTRSSARAWYGPLELLPRTGTAP